MLKNWPGVPFSCFWTQKCFEIQQEPLGNKATPKREVIKHKRLKVDGQKVKRMPQIAQEQRVATAQGPQTLATSGLRGQTWVFRTQLKKL